MRLPIILGALWFVGCTAASYRVFARSAPATIVERRAVSAPTPAPLPPHPERVPPAQFLRDEIAPPPEPQFLAPREARAAPERIYPRDPGGYRPPSPGLQPAVPYQVSPLPAPTPPSDQSMPEPAGVCLVCGERADSWVEMDGRRQGYCPKHVSKVRVPLPPPPAAAAPVSGFGPAPQAPRGASETGSVQCQGMTRAGAQCRRKTRDPSGLCYQHRR